MIKTVIIILGCNDSNVFGSNCDKPCPTTCKESKCHIVQGTCLKCRPGWTGYYCNQGIAFSEDTCYFFYTMSRKFYRNGFL